MPKVVGIRFNRATKVYYFDPNGIGDLPVGDRVIVETARGTEMGIVASSPHEVPEVDIIGKLKPVIRRAEPYDLVQAESFMIKERQALTTCKELVTQHKLPMKMVRAEYSFDGSRLTFYFTSEKRVDFRALVRELARVFHTRIELRQIGVRDEAKLLGGLGCCGRLLCCDTWLCEFTPVSIKMAKQQDLPLNPMEISGICGRLLCCLSYENDFYNEAKQRLPKLGRTVTTKEGKGKVIGQDVFNDRLKVMLENEVIVEMGLEDLVDERFPPHPREEMECACPLKAAEPAPAPRAAETGKSSRHGKRRKKKRSGAASGSRGGRQPQTDN